MPLHFTISKRDRLVETVGEGRIDFPAITQYQGRLVVHPDFDPSFDQIVDFTAVGEIALSTEEIQQWAVRKIFTRSARRVGITSDGLHRGIFCMFRAYHHIFGAEEAMHLARTRAEALAWLSRSPVAVSPGP
jgi:hypothetical protein